MFAVPSSAHPTICPPMFREKSSEKTMVQSHIASPAQRLGVHMSCPARVPTTTSMTPPHAHNCSLQTTLPNHCPLLCIKAPRLSACMLCSFIFTEFQPTDFGLLLFKSFLNLCMLQKTMLAKCCCQLIIPDVVGLVLYYPSVSPTKLCISCFHVWI